MGRHGLGLVLGLLLTGSGIATALLTGSHSVPPGTGQETGADAAVVPESIQPVSYIALGDSIATGIWSAAGYVWRYAAHLQADLGSPVQTTNLAVNGWTTGDLLRALRSNETYRNAVANADVITISIGGNDLLQARAQYLRGACGGPANTDCLDATTDRILAAWDAILDEVLAITGDRPVAIRTMDVYNPFVRVDLEELPVLKPYLDEINASFCRAAEERGVGCARVYAAFNGPGGEEDPTQQALIAPDGLHPSDRGHALIADLLREVGYAPVR